MNKTVINVITIFGANEPALFVQGAMECDATRSGDSEERWHVIPMRSIRHMRLAPSPSSWDGKERLVLSLTDGQTFYSDATFEDATGLFLEAD